MIGSPEDLRRQSGTDPGSWQCFRKGGESIKGIWFSSDATARLIRAEHRPCGREIAERAFLACEAHLIRMADSSFIMTGFAPEKQDNGVDGIDSCIVVDTLCRVYNSVTDKDNRPANLS
jgi:hypothetical protein